LKKASQSIITKIKSGGSKCLPAVWAGRNSQVKRSVLSGSGLRREYSRQAFAARLLNVVSSEAGAGTPNLI